MKHKLFKYVSNLDHAKLLISGKVFHRTLGYFRDYLDASAKQVIGDEFESTRIFRPVDGLEVSNLSSGTSGLLDMAYEYSVRASGEIYIFCTSLRMTEELKREFGAVACVEITNPRAFTKRWQRALQPGARYFARRVQYYESVDMPGNIWEQPRRIATTKLARFANQHEYRFGFSITGALDFGQCSNQLADRKARPNPKLDEHHDMTLDLGDLNDICKLHVLQ